jgi:hypothetical protein
VNRIPVEGLPADNELYPDATAIEYGLIAATDSTVSKRNGDSPDATMVEYIIDAPYTGLTRRLLENSGIKVRNDHLGS